MTDKFRLSFLEKLFKIFRNCLCVIPTLINENSPYSHYYYVKKTFICHFLSETGTLTVNGGERNGETESKPCHTWGKCC